jgi:asparaginyl-tRNA synthetase
MEHVYISQIADYADKDVTLKGWLYNKRSSGKIVFLQIRDGTGIIQAVIVKGEVSDDVFKQAETLGQESSIIVTGKVRKDTRSQIGYELTVKDLTCLQQVTDYPISPKEHGVDFLLSNRHLWLRSTRQHAIMRIRNEIIKAIRDFFDKEGFILIDTPIFTPSICEGTTTLFETKYFDTKVYLTQSGQLYSEASCMAHGKVYCFGPTFRAEKSKTRRHLTEFWMVEPEVAYFDLNDNMRLAEDFISFIIERVLKNQKENLTKLERDVTKLEKIKAPFPKITYTDAIEILKSKNFNIKWGDDFGGDEETAISNDFDKPVIIHRYPASCKAFYMKNAPENKDLALGMDILAPEGYGEIIGGGQREDDYETLKQKIISHNLPLDAFSWYLDLRKYGSVPHSGFGLGIERCVAWICGLAHVRETIPFPRMLERIWP